MQLTKIYVSPSFCKSASSFKFVNSTFTNFTTITELLFQGNKSPSSTSEASSSERPPEDFKLFSTEDFFPAKRKEHSSESGEAAASSS